MKQLWKRSFEFSTLKRSWNLLFMFIQIENGFGCFLFVMMKMSWTLKKSSKKQINISRKFFSDKESKTGRLIPNSCDVCMTLSSWHWVATQMWNNSEERRQNSIGLQVSHHLFDRYQLHQLHRLNTKHLSFSFVSWHFQSMKIENKKICSYPEIFMCVYLPTF
jgi:hypothetical protein